MATLFYAADTPSKVPLPVGDLDPHLIHDSLGPPESALQTASRSVQPFFSRLNDQQKPSLRRRSKA